LSLEDESQLLSIVKGRAVGVRGLAEAMRMRTQTMVSLIKKMVAMGLVEVSPERVDKRGRPRQVVSITMLGDDYLKTFNELKVKPLRSNRNDLMKARRDAEYVNRLVARGRDPCQAFLELNRIVRGSRDPK